MEEKVEEKWDIEQKKLAAALCSEFDVPRESLVRVAGVDISFIKDNDTDACACFCILSYPRLEVLFASTTMVSMTVPYIPGYLAFREAPLLAKVIKEVLEERGDIAPQVLFVDGNGVLHPRGFGLACHLGVLVDIPTIGVGKTFLQVDGLTAKGVRERHDEQRAKGAGGDDCRGGVATRLRGASGREWGASFTYGEDICKPIFISAGHRMDLDTALELTSKCCRYRQPEPIRMADQLSRAFLRERGLGLGLGLGLEL